MPMGSFMLKVVGAGVAGVLVVAMARETPSLLPGFAAWVDSLGPLGPVAFIAGYSIAPVILAPAFLLTIAAGAIFGFAAGVLYVMIGATIGSTLAFLAGRYVARGFVEKLLARDPRLVAIDRAVERQGFRLVFLLRMSPALPYTLVNYALGLSRVRLVDYVVASIGMLPLVAAYVYSGQVVGDLTAVAGGVSAPRGPTFHAMTGLGIVATIVMSVVATRLARRAIAQSVESGGD
jgi:uncharacterized membrane protein YdjX (TVP38/TMEM64 family)